MEQLLPSPRPCARSLRGAGLGAACAALAVSATTAFAQCNPEWDEQFADADLSATAEVHSFVEFNDGSGPALYVGGIFGSVAGQPAGGFARWDGQEWSLPSPGLTDAPIQALAVYDDGSGPAIYAGGAFNTIGGESISQIARYDHVNDTWHPVGGGVNFGFNGVTELVAYDGDLYALGEANFSAAIERWDGSQWFSITTTDLLEVNAAVVHDGFLYIGGTSASSFTGSVERWDGMSMALAGDGLGSGVNSLASFDGTLYAGTSCNAGSDISQCVFEWQGNVLWLPATGSDPFGIDLPASFPGPSVRTLHVADDGNGEALYAGGAMVNLTDGAFNVARFDGSNWSAVPLGVYSGSSGSPGGNVYAIHGFDDGNAPGVYVGGIFDVAQNDGDAPFASRSLARFGCFDSIVLDPADPNESNLLASETVISSYGGTTSITVESRGADGTLLAPGRDVVISTTAGNLIGSVDDLGDGTYRQVLEGVPGPNGATVTATVDGVMLADSVFIDFVPVDPVLSSIVVSPAEVFEGDVSHITVTPRDGNGTPVGAGLDVNISTTLGDLAGAVTDNGDGTYSQSILATSIGTANISVTVDGLPLQNTGSLTVIDPANYGLVVGVDAIGQFIGYSSIQEAINNADDDELAALFISSGTYEETVQIDGRSGLELIGLSAAESVVVRGFVLSDSSDIHLRAITVDATGGPNDGIRLSGGPHKNDGVEIVDLHITGANKNGIRIERDNENVLIEDSVISGNGRNGVDCHLSGFNYALLGNTISENGYNGVSIGRDVVILLQENIITGNGVAGGNGGGRYGIDRQRKAQDGTPEEVTLIQNVIEDNNGKSHNGRSDENINNYDQIIDASDDQSPYTD